MVAAVTIGGYRAGLKDHILCSALRLGAPKEKILEILQRAHFHTGALAVMRGKIALVDVAERNGTAGNGCKDRCCTRSQAHCERGCALDDVRLGRH